MHVGYLTFESPWEANQGGGIAAYLRAIVPSIAALGHRVTVFTASQEPGVAVSHGGLVRTVSIRLPNLHWYLSKVPGPGRLLSLPVRHLEWSAKFHQVIREAFTREPLDLIEAPELGALFLATGRLCPLVIRLHGSNYVFNRHSGERLGIGECLDHKLERITRGRARFLTSPSSFQAAETARDSSGLAGRIRVIPNPISREVLEEALKTTSPDPSRVGEPQVLYCGRLARVKGIEPLLQAAGIVAERDPRVRFLLAGSWQMPGKPDLVGAGRFGANLDNVRWVGHAPWRELAGHYRRSSLFVMPSYYETFGIACLEAMAFGLPVVASRVGGLPEIVRDGVGGALVPPGEPVALAQAILELLGDEDVRRRFGQAGHQLVVREFTPDLIARKTLQLYAEARG